MTAWKLENFSRPITGYGEPRRFEGAAAMFAMREARRELEREIDALEAKQ